MHVGTRRIEKSCLNVDLTAFNPRHPSHKREEVERRRKKTPRHSYINNIDGTTGSLWTGSYIGPFFGGSRSLSLSLRVCLPSIEKGLQAYSERKVGQE